MFKFIIDAELDLRLLEETHAEELFVLINSCRDYLRAWLPWVDDTKELKDTKNYIKNVAKKQYVNNLGFITGIWYRDQLVGVLELSIEEHNKRGTIGYWLGREFQGQGMMTRANATLIDYAFQKLKLHKIEIRCAEENQSSRAIPERLGFVQEGTIRDAEYLYDHYVCQVVYGMLESEWEINKKK